MTRQVVMRSCGLIGPVAFVTAWVIGGALSDDLSPVQDSISSLAASGASTRPLMTAGFVIFGIATASYGVSLRSRLSGPAGIAAIATGVCTLAVAATPLEVAPWVDTLHGTFAGAGYLTLAAVPLLAAGPLRRLGHAKGAAVSVVAGTTSLVALALSVSGLGATGLLQRVGLTIGDMWIVASAIAVSGSRPHVGHVTT